MLENRNLIEAQRLLNKCIDTDPRNSSYWCSQGVMYFEAGNREKAFEYMKKAIEINDQIPETIHNYAVLLEHIGNDIEAIKQYQNLLRLSKFEEFAKKRLTHLQNGAQNSKNSIRNTIIYLKHHENIIPNTLKILHLNKKVTINDINSTFKIVSKKNPEQLKALAKVRFMNVPSLNSIYPCTSEDNREEDKSFQISLPQDKEMVMTTGETKDKQDTGTAVSLHNLGAEQQKKQVVKPTGNSILDMIRQAETEKISTSKPTNLLGETAKWKSFGKSKLFSKKTEVADAAETSKESPKSSFKEALDTYPKGKNDSEISFGQGAVKVPELCNLLSAYQAEITTHRVTTEEVIEFKTLTEKIYKLCNKHKKEVPQVVVEESHIPTKIGTPSFKVAKPKLYTPAMEKEVSVFNQANSGIYKDEIEHGDQEAGRNLESDRWSMYNDIANQRDFKS